MQPINIYIIDDHAVALQGLFHIFDIEQHGIKVIGGSLSVDEAITALVGIVPDVILLDLFLKDQNPAFNIKKVKKAFPSTPIIIFTCDNSLCWQVDMFRHGVNAYLSKETDSALLIDTIHSVYRGETIISSYISDILLCPDLYSEDSRLPQEFCEIIKMLAIGFNHKDIASKLNKSESAVTKQLACIRTIFDVKSNTELVLKVMTNRIPH